MGDLWALKGLFDEGEQIFFVQKHNSGGRSVTYPLGTSRTSIVVVVC